MSLTAGYSWPSRTTVRIVIGSVVDGRLSVGNRPFDLSPGALAAIGAARQWLRGPWFLTATGTLAASRTATAAGDDGVGRVGLTAVDLRGGLMAGRTMGPVSPYVLARGFGGPVLWTLDDERVTGTDRYKYQLGAGITVATKQGVSIAIDASLVGERALSAGITLPL